MLPPAGVVPRLKQFRVVGIIKPESMKQTAAWRLPIWPTHRNSTAWTRHVGLRLRLADPQNAPAVMDALVPEALQQSQQLWVRNWTDNNRSYFNAVEMEKTPADALADLHRRRCRL